MFKAIFSTGAIYVLVQASLPSLPPTDHLHEAFNSVTAQQGSPFKMEFGGCMRTARSLGDVTCYFQLLPRAPVEATASEPKARPETLKMELPGGEENTRQASRVAGILAATLIPNLDDAAVEKLVQGLQGATKDAFGDASEQLKGIRFDLHSEKSKNLLRIEIPK